MVRVGKKKDLTPLMRYGVTQQAFREGLLRQADGDAAKQASRLPNGITDYYEKQRRLGPEIVTP